MHHSLSDDQRSALERIIDWRRSCLQEYTVGGYAGTGKTTLIARLYEMWPRTLVCALCGKAAQVLRSKGVPASTIHSLIYVPFTGADGRIRFKRRRQLEVKVELFIVDEASMIDHLLYQDLLSYGIKVLWVGDHGQLPPIGTNPHLMRDPAVRLERIHRQVADNPILQAAQAFREGRVPLNNWRAADGRLEFTSAYRFWEYVEPNGPQIICGYNATRQRINAYVRRQKGFTDPQPSAGDRIMFLRNNYDYGVFNGQQAEVLEVGESNAWFVNLDVQLEDGKVITLPCSTTQFGQPLDQEHKDKAIVLADYAYAITAHKAQGSEYPSVVALEEIARPWNPARWRYTVATRAKERLVYCS